MTTTFHYLTEIGVLRTHPAISIGAGSMFDEFSEAITHVVIDLPAVLGPSSTADGMLTTNAEDRRRKYC